MLDAGVVDQDVHLAEFARCKLHHVLDLGGLGHVCAVVRDLHAQGRNLAFGAFYIAKTVKHDVGALACQRKGDTQTDTTGGAGHERCFAFEHESYSESIRMEPSHYLYSLCFFHCVL